MKQTVFIKVDVKDRLPKQIDNGTLSEWVGVFSFETILGEAMYDFENKCFQLSSLDDSEVTHWLCETEIELPSDEEIDQHYPCSYPEDSNRECYIIDRKREGAKWAINKIREQLKITK
jgi:hypothetical protein